MLLDPRQLGARQPTSPCLCSTAVIPVLCLDTPYYYGCVTPIVMETSTTTSSHYAGMSLQDIFAELASLVVSLAHAKHSEMLICAVCLSPFPFLLLSAMHMFTCLQSIHCQPTSRRVGVHRTHLFPSRTVSLVLRRFHSTHQTRLARIQPPTILGTFPSCLFDASISLLL